MSVEATLSGEGQFSAGLALDQHTNVGLLFSVAIDGVFSGILTLQVSFDREVTWKTSEDTFDKPTVKMSVPIAELHASVRLIFLAGDYISGDANVRLGHYVVD